MSENFYANKETSRRNGIYFKRAGAVIKSARLAKGVFATEVDRALGWKIKTVSLIESNFRSCSLGELAAIAEQLEIDLMEILAKAVEVEL